VEWGGGGGGGGCARLHVYRISDKIHTDTVYQIILGLVNQRACLCYLFCGYLHDKEVVFHIPPHKIITSGHTAYHLHVQVHFSEREVGRAHPVHTFIHAKYRSLHQTCDSNYVYARWSENVKFKHPLQTKSWECWFVYSQKRNTYYLVKNSLLDIFNPLRWDQHIIFKFYTSITQWCSTNSQNAGLSTQVLW
jgi:hypothetical protein